MREPIRMLEMQYPRLDVFEKKEKIIFPKIIKGKKCTETIHPYPPIPHPLTPQFLRTLAKQYESSSFPLFF